MYWKKQGDGWRKGSLLLLFLEMVRNCSVNNPELSLQKGGENVRGKRKGT